jgi:N-acyl-D-amino-acid deacylase
MHDIAIRGGTVVEGTVVDGTGAAAYRADIAIDGGRITAIGEGLGAAREVIDATVAIVTPRLHRYSHPL